MPFKQRAATFGCYSCFSSRIRVIQIMSTSFVQVSLLIYTTVAGTLIQFVAVTYYFACTSVKVYWFAGQVDLHDAYGDKHRWLVQLTRLCLNDPTDNLRSYSELMLDCGDTEYNTHMATLAQVCFVLFLHF